MRKVGYSKQRRVAPQVVVGLLADPSGLPLSVSCFEGNRAETRTIIPVLTSYLRAHSMETTGVVVVAEAGMLWAANLVALDEAGLGFIVGSRQSRAPLELEAHQCWNRATFTDSQVIETITPEAGRGKALKNGVSDPMVRAEPVWDRQSLPDS